MSAQSHEACDRFGPLVEAFRDGLLTGDERTLVAEHLASCADCADDVGMGPALYAAHQVVAARDGPWGRPEEAKPLLRPVAWHRPAVAAAAAAAVIAAVTVTLPRGGETAGTTLNGGAPRPAPSVEGLVNQPARPNPVGVEIVSGGNVTLEVAPADSASRRER